MSGGGSSNSKYANSVFYATSYHPIQAGSIDGTDILPHDNAVYRAGLCSSAGLYDPFGDPKLIGDDPYCTLFVGHLSHFTTEDTLRQAMSKYGRVKNLRLIRHIVTGASRGYAFVEYESEREMLRAYEDAHHSIIDDCEIIVDYNRQQLMSGWIPRRLGGGIGGKKESGQLRFGGRERPFRAPLRPIPFDDLKRLGILPPPEGRYLTRYQVPSPPRRRSSLDMDEPSYLHKRHKHSKHSHRHERRSSSCEDHLSDSKQSHQHESRKSNSEDHPSDRKLSQWHGRRMSSTKDYPSASKHSHQHERRRSRSKDHLSSDSKHSHRYERRRSSSDTSDSKYSDRHEQRRSINEDHPSASKHSKRHERRRSSTKDHPSDSRFSHQHERRRPSSKDQPSDSKDSHQHERRRSTSEDHSSD